MQNAPVDLIDSKCPYESVPQIRAKVEDIVDQIEQAELTEEMVGDLHDYQMRLISMLAHYCDGERFKEITPTMRDEMRAVEERIDVLLQAIEDPDLPDA